MPITLTIAVMSRRGVLGYQEGSTHCDFLHLPRREVPEGVFSAPATGVPYGVRPRPWPNTFLTDPKLLLTATPPLADPNRVAPPGTIEAALSRLGVDPNKAVSASSSKILMIPARRRANIAAISTGLDNLFLDSGIPEKIKNTKNHIKRGFKIEEAF